MSEQSQGMPHGNAYRVETEPVQEVQAVTRGGISVSADSSAGVASDLNPDIDYGYLYGQLTSDKIPQHIYDKIMCGEDFTSEEEKEIIQIIAADKKERGIE